MKLLPLLVLPLAACSGIAIRTDFEGGSLGRVEQVSETRFRCAVAGQSDQDGRNRQASWYYFRLDGAKGREVTITLTDLRGEYNYRPGGLCVRDDTPPVVSADGKTWRHLGEAISLEKDEATFRVTPDSDTLWIAHIEPYTHSRLERLVDEIRGKPGLVVDVLGKSVEGRDLYLLTFPATATSSVPPRVVWLMCRQHAWETGTSFVGEGAIRYLLSKEAEPLRANHVFRILPMMDPDGCARGGVRFNRNGYDVNRNWDSADPANPESRRLMPEICAAKKAIVPPWGLFLTLHNQESGEWLSGSEKHQATAEAFFAALQEKTTFNPSDKGPRAPGPKYPPGRATVYEYLDRERGYPAFLMEQGITRSSKLGRLPTSQDRLDFGRQLIRVMADVAMGK